MKLTIGADRLNQAIGRVMPIVPSKPSLPMLAYLLLTAEDDGILRVTGTDMDMLAAVEVSCAVEQTGAAVVFARRIHEFVRELSGDITLSVEADGNMQIAYDGGAVDMPVMTAEDYPAVDLGAKGTEIALSGHDLTRLVQLSGYATAVERTRIMLTGALLEIATGVMTMVSTDGHRLAMSRRQARITVKTQVDAILPAPLLKLAVRLVADGCELQGVTVAKSTALFRYSGVMLRGKLVAGPYPSWRQVVPTDNPHRATVAVVPFERAIRRALAVANAVTHLVRLTLRPEALTVSLTNTDTGVQFREEMECVYAGEPMEIGFNGQYVREMLNKIESDEIDIELATSTSATIFRPAKSEDCEELQYLLMPLRLND